MLPEVREDELAELYAWIDTIPLSKPKKSIARDFADAVCMAEVVHHYFPRLVELHNYSPTSNSAQKVYNWTTLDQRVFSKLGFTLSKDECKDVALAQPGAIERVLKLVHTKLAQYQARHGAARTSRLHSYAEGAAAATGNNHFASPGRLQTPTTDANGHRTAEGSAWQHRARPSSAYEQDGFSPELAMDVTPPELKQSKHHPEEQQFKAAQLSRSPDDSGLIRSFMGREEREEELQELRALNKVLEVKASKMEQLLRLKDAKIAALTARLQEAGLA